MEYDDSCNSRLASLTLAMIVPNPKSPHAAQPLLKVKAAEARHFLPALTRYCQSHVQSPGMIVREPGLLVWRNCRNGMVSWRMSSLSPSKPSPGDYEICCRDSCWTMRSSMPRPSQVLIAQESMPRISVMLANKNRFMMHYHWSFRSED